MNFKIKIWNCLNSWCLLLMIHRTFLELSFLPPMSMRQRHNWASGEATPARERRGKGSGVRSWGSESRKKGKKRKERRGSRKRATPPLTNWWRTHHHLPQPREAPRRKMDPTGNSGIWLQIQTRPPPPTKELEKSALKPYSLGRPIWEIYRQFYCFMMMKIIWIIIYIWQIHRKSKNKSQYFIILPP